MGQEEGEQILSVTKLSHEWCYIRTVAGQPYTVQISYHNLVTHGRPVPNCSMRLCRPGLVYSLAFFDEFAANIGVQFCGLLHEGSGLTLDKTCSGPAGLLAVSVWRPALRFGAVVAPKSRTRSH